MDEKTEKSEKGVEPNEVVPSPLPIDQTGLPFVNVTYKDPKTGKVKINAQLYLRVIRPKKEVSLGPEQELIVVNGSRSSGKTYLADLLRTADKSLLSTEYKNFVGISPVVIVDTDTIMTPLWNSLKTIPDRYRNAYFLEHIQDSLTSFFAKQDPNALILLFGVTDYLDDGDGSRYTYNVPHFPGQKTSLYFIDADAETILKSKYQRDVLGPLKNNANSYLDPASDKKPPEWSAKDVFFETVTDRKAYVDILKFFPMKQKDLYDTLLRRIKFQYGTKILGKKTLPS